MNKRRRMTTASRIRVFDAANGICHRCALPIQPPHEAWAVDHVKPLWLGGADNETNWAPIHIDCHRDKTSAEAPVRAKSDRIRAKHLGIKKPDRNRIRVWRGFDKSIRKAKETP